jgi:hypothetical protein
MSDLFSLGAVSISIAVFSLGAVFGAIALILLGLTVQDYLKAEGKLTIARATWLRVTFIFAAVGIGLNVVGWLLF